MASGDFDACLAVTLTWEGGYSNNPDDPGGPTMRGVIQREYDAFRAKRGLPRRPVRQIGYDELLTIYREQYWNAAECDNAPAGLDLCLFDGVVNSGVPRGLQWLNGGTPSIDAYCDARLAFLRDLGHLWRVFGAGWARRVEGIRHSAHAMAGALAAAPAALAPFDIHGGMHGDHVASLQAALSGLGYPVGAVDGWYGVKTHAAVVLFQHDNDLAVTGDWSQSCQDKLAAAKPRPALSLAAFYEVAAPQGFYAGANTSAPDAPSTADPAQEQALVSASRWPHLTEEQMIVIRDQVHNIGISAGAIAATLGYHFSSNQLTAAGIVFAVFSAALSSRSILGTLKTLTAA